MATVIDSVTGWTCAEGASLIAQATSRVAGRVPNLHAVIYVCEAHRADADATITAAGYLPDIEAAPPAHRSDPWPCGHVTAYESEAADALNLAAAERRRLTHYAKSANGDALCGAEYLRSEGIVALEAYTSCPRCLALLADLAAAPPRRAAAPRSEIRAPLPGSGFMVSYRSQGERDRTLRLAEARQQIAHEGNGNPTWQELTDDERGTSELSARNWLRAAERAGLLGGVDTEADLL